MEDTKRALSDEGLRGMVDEQLVLEMGSRRIEWYDSDKAFPDSRVEYFRLKEEVIRRMKA